MRRTAAAALLVVIVGCTSQAPLQASIRERATAVCKTALDAKKTQGPFPFPAFNPTRPDRSKLPAIGRFEETTVVIYERWVSQARALGQPSPKNKQWSEFLSAPAQNLIREQQHAAASGDTATFTQTYYSGNQSSNA
jgi:hypothetical protein